MLRRELSLSYTDCGSTILKPNDFDPNIPVTGQEYTYLISGISTGNFSNGLFFINLKYDNNIPLFSEVVDACSVMNCPLKQGDYFTLQYTFVWPSFIRPTIEDDFIRSSITVTDQLGNIGFCGKLDYAVWPNQPTTTPTPSSDDTVYFNIMLLTMIFGGFICLIYCLFSGFVKHSQKL